MSQGTRYDRISDEPRHDEANNAQAEAGPFSVAEDETFYVTAFTASYSAGATGTLSIVTASGTTLWEHEITDFEHVAFPCPVEVPKGEDPSAQLEASGAADNLGRVTLFGYRVQDY